MTCVHTKPGYFPQPVKGGGRGPEWAHNGPCKRLLRYVRFVASPQRVCVQRRGTGSTAGWELGWGGGPELCVCVERGGTWDGVGRKAALESSWRQALAFVCIFFFIGFKRQSSRILPYWEEKACIPPSPHLSCYSRHDLGGGGVLGEGVECVGNGVYKERSR